MRGRLRSLPSHKHGEMRGFRERMIPQNATSSILTIKIFTFSIDMRVFDVIME